MLIPNHIQSEKHYMVGIGSCSFPITVTCTIRLCDALRVTDYVASTKLVDMPFKPHLTPEGGKRLYYANMRRITNVDYTDSLVYTRLGIRHVKNNKRASL